MAYSVVAENLSKQYEIGQFKRDDLIQEALIEWIKHPFRKRRGQTESVWVLQGVSFQVKEGEVVGIIGRNGAGKSTLLKILSRITYPTSGKIEARGRIAALLEVGTGFHGELTGRENIFLNGSILGMRRKEIEGKLDAIIEFAGVEQFIDTPVKRYSSGMFLRLGFAVAAHLEPDVLVIDEVLAVGDVGFQRKCLNAMSELRNGGRTVLFVSHNMAAVENLCSRVLWIDNGRLRQDGDAKEVISAYMSTFAEAADQQLDLRKIEARRGSGNIRYTKVEFLDDDRKPTEVVRSGDRLVIRLHYEAKKQLENLIFGVEIHTQLGTAVAQVSTYNDGVEISVASAGCGYIDVEIRELNLMPGCYYLSLEIANYGRIYHDVLQHCAVLDVQRSGRYGLGRGMTAKPVMCLSCAWEHRPVTSAILREETVGQSLQLANY